MHVPLGSSFLDFLITISLVFFDLNLDDPRLEFIHLNRLLLIILSDFMIRDSQMHPFFLVVIVLQTPVSISALLTVV